MTQKSIILLIFLLSVLVAKNTFGQSNHTDFFISCSDTLVFDTVTVEQKIIRYKLISSKQYNINKEEVVIGEIILPDFNVNSDKSKLILFLNAFGAQNKINRFIAFQDCGAHFIYISSFAPGSKERNSIQERLIGTFNVPEIK